MSETEQHLGDLLARVFGGENARVNFPALAKNVAANIRRAALEDAVKATCMYCESGDLPVRIRRRTLLVHKFNDPEIGDQICLASDIHNLLAAEPQQPGTTRGPAMEPVRDDAIEWAGLGGTTHVPAMED